LPDLVGLPAAIFIGDDIRTITDADRAVIRECDDPDGLLALQLRLQTGVRVRGRRPVLLATGGMGIVLGMLIISFADATAIVLALVALVGLFAAGFVLQSRARKRAIAAVGWLGAISFRLAQLAARQQ